MYKLHLDSVTLYMTARSKLKTISHYQDSLYLGASHVPVRQDTHT